MSMIRDVSKRPSNTTSYSTLKGVSRCYLDAGMWKREVKSILPAMILIPMALSGCTPPPPTQEIRWTFGGDGDEKVVAVRESSDGGYVVAGTTGDGDEGTSAIALLKIDSDGRQVWGRTFAGDFYDDTTTLLRLPGDKFVVIGTTDVYNGGSDPDDYTSYDSHAYAVCVDGNGATQWEKTFGTESPRAAAVTEEGDLVVGGVSSSRTLDGMYLSRISAEGELLWIKAVGDESAEPYALRITSDGNVILVGSSDDGPFLAKADGDGNLLWQRSNFDDRISYFPDLIETSQGDFVLLGHSFEAFSPSTMLVKTDTNGNPSWTGFPSSDGILFYGANAIAEASDGGYVLAGVYEYGLLLPDSVAGMYLLKTDSNGHGLWSRVYAKGHQAPVANFVEAAEDGGYILAGHDGGILDETGVGYDNYDMTIVKTDANGNIESAR